LEGHKHNPGIVRWLEGKNIVLCPLTELGFLRIATNTRIPGMGIPMQDARDGLEKFAAERKAIRIPDDLPALESRGRTSDQVTDIYLAELATKHGMKLATLDAGIQHPAIELIG
jgi:predicted nucleic acid-binding protein